VKFVNNRRYPRDDSNHRLMIGPEYLKIPIVITRPQSQDVMAHQTRPLFRFFIW